MTIRSRYLISAFLALLAAGVGLFWHSPRDLVDGSFEVVERDGNLPPPEEIAFIDPSGKVSSKCIGKPVTPICAVDTYLACLIWQRPDLCRLVRDHPRDDGKTKYLSRSYRLEYVVERVRRPWKFEWNSFFAETDRPDLLINPPPGKYQKGDPRMVWMIVEQRGCAVEAPEECAEFSDEQPGMALWKTRFVTFSYLVISEKRRWKIISNDTNLRVILASYGDDTLIVGAHHPAETRYWEYDDID